MINDISRFILSALSVSSLIFLTNVTTIHAAAPAADAAPAAAQPTDNPLAAKVRRVLDNYFTHPLDARTETPWSIVHWIIAFGVDAELKTSVTPSGRASAIGWLCVNNPCNGQQLVADRGSSFELPIAPGVQGHDGQFLGALAQSRVKSDYIFRLGKRDLTVADLIEYEKQSCRTGIELTFKLIALCHYEGTDAKWKNNRGEEWSVVRLLHEELNQPINAYETCGGLHRLFAISYAADCREAEGQPLTGDWKTAREKAHRYQRRAFELQNADGSFSTAWLDRSEQRSDVTRRLTTSGHVLEWLANSLPEGQLHDSKFERAVNFIATTLDGKQGTSLHRGAMSHSLHSLVIYEQRALGAKPGDRTARLAPTIADANN